MNTRDLLLCIPALITPGLTACDMEDAMDDDIELRAIGQIHDAAADFDDQNPNGVWSYGFGAGGGDFTASPSYSQNAVVAVWGGGAGADGWRGLTKNLTAQSQTLHGGLVVPAESLMMHPGNSANAVSKIRFTAPASACFAVDVTWRALDQQAKKTRPMVFTNAASASGTVPANTAPGFKQLFAQDLVGFGSSAAFAGTIAFQAGEILSVELGNGGDGYYDDGIGVELVVAEVQCPPKLLGHWTFEPSVETVDLSGKWGPLQLGGNATISDGQLHVHGVNLTATGWASAAGYTGPTIREKTLVSWVALDNLNVRSGSALTLDTTNGAMFDGIVFGERVARRWMAGSDWFKRTMDVMDTDETVVGQTIQMAAAYRDVGAGQVEVTLCRDGVQLGQYVKAPLQVYFANWTEAHFGRRFISGSTHPGAIEGRIEEARIYDRALSCAEVAALPAPQ